MSRPYSFLVTCSKSCTGLHHNLVSVNWLYCVVGEQTRSLVHKHIYEVYLLLDLPGGSDDKASACNVGDPGSIPGSGRSLGEGNGNPLHPALLPGKSKHPGVGDGQVGLACCSPWGHKELDTAERLN